MKGLRKQDAPIGVASRQRQGLMYSTNQRRVLRLDGATQEVRLIVEIYPISKLILFRFLGHRIRRQDKGATSRKMIFVCGLALLKRGLQETFYSTVPWDTEQTFEMMLNLPASRGELGSFSVSFCSNPFPYPWKPSS